MYTFVTLAQIKKQKLKTHTHSVSLSDRPNSSSRKRPSKCSHIYITSHPILILIYPTYYLPPPKNKTDTKYIYISRSTPQQTQLQQRETALKAAEQALARLESRMARGVGDYDPATTKVENIYVHINVCICICNICICICNICMYVYVYVCV